MTTRLAETIFGGTWCKPSVKSLEWSLQPLQEEDAKRILPDSSWDYISGGGHMLMSGIPGVDVG